MNTLTQPSVKALLDRLFAEADASTADLRSRLAAKSEEERKAFMATMHTDYRSFYGQAKEYHLAVSRETGTLLYMLARSGSARRVIEFGTSFGISTIHLAAAVRDNGGGTVITTEFEPSKVEKARANIAAAGLADLVIVREGDAIETLQTDLPEAIDLALLDGAKSLYPKVLGLLEPRLRPGAFVVADNADASPEYLTRVRSDGYLSVPFGADVEVSMRAA